MSSPEPVRSAQTRWSTRRSDGKISYPFRDAALHRQARILHLFVTLPVGGAENLLLSIVRRLDHGRFASVVCCIGKRGVIGDQFAAMDVPLMELRLMNKGGFDRRVVPALVE